MAQQVKFYDPDNDMEVGGILLEDGTLIDGCSGGEISKKSQEENGFEITEVFETWVDINDEIIGY